MRSEGLAITRTRSATVRLPAAMLAFGLAAAALLANSNRAHAAIPLPVTAGNTFSLNPNVASPTELLASFTDPNDPPDCSPTCVPTETLRNYTATVDWGDGTGATSAPVSGGALISGTQTYQVKAAHTYGLAAIGTHTVTVVVNDNDGEIGSATDTATVARPTADFTVTGGTTVLAKAGHDTGFQLLGTLADGDAINCAVPGPYCQQAEEPFFNSYLAKVDWGDGSAVDTTNVEVRYGTPLCLPDPDGVCYALEQCFDVQDVYTNCYASFSIYGRHTYAVPGSYQAAVQITDLGGKTTADLFTTTVVAFTPTNTSVTLKSSTNPSGFGDSVTITATVVPGMPIGDLMTGNVTVLDGATPVSTTPVGSDRTVSYTTSSLGLGDHNFTAAYGGDANFNPAPASAPLKQTVQKHAVAVSGSWTPDPSGYGQSVSLSATVQPAGTPPSPPTGSVSFMEGSTTVATAPLTSGGTATTTVTSLSAGSHSIVAHYSGDSSFLAGTAAAITQTVNKAATTTTMSSSPNPSTLGQVVTYTAHVSLPAGLSPASAPSGAVIFKEGTAQLGQATLQANGTAVLINNGLPPGLHSIVASYAGDGNFAPSDSAPYSQALAGVTLTSSANPSQTGKSVGFTATVTGVGPTGTVTFKDGPKIIGTVALSGGQATLTIQLGAGLHLITAQYGGDGNNPASHSSPLLQVVSRPVPPPGLALSSQPPRQGPPPPRP